MDYHNSNNRNDYEQGEGIWGFCLRRGHVRKGTKVLCFHLRPKNDDNEAATIVLRATAFSVRSTQQVGTFWSNCPNSGFLGQTQCPGVPILSAASPSIITVCQLLAEVIT
jgi:hypothetical protein